MRRTSWWLVLSVVVGLVASASAQEDPSFDEPDSAPIELSPLVPAPAAPIRGRFRPPADATRVEGPGRFDPRLIVRVIQTRQAAFRACYERELRAAPELEGTVVLTMRIEESGSVTQVRVLPESTLPNAAVGSCVTGVAARFRFTPGPEGGPFTAVMTLTFEPQTS